MARPLLLVLAVGALMAAGCEEERRAWVSILPVGDEEEEMADEGRPAGPLAISGDGRVVLLGEDTLFTAGRLPSRIREAAGGSRLRFQRVVFSPDSARIAFSTSGGRHVVGMWSRAGQTGFLLDVFPEGGVDSLAWAPGGRFLAWSGRGPEAVPRVSLADPAGRRLRHPVVEALAREGRPVVFQSWIDPGRARVLVTSAPGAEGGPAYVWDGVVNNFVLESHIEPLVQRAPPAPPVAGGVFSVDLIGDTAPETAALYRSGGAPAILLLEGRTGEFRARTTDPLLDPADVGLERWEDGTQALGLYASLRVDGATLLLLEVPSPLAGVRTVAAFRVGGDGALEMARIAMPGRVVPAVFQDGRIEGESRQLGVVDLDADGVPELVVAIGIPVDADEGLSVRWRATVLGWEGEQLEPRPGLEAEALARIARATGSPADSTAAADGAEIP